MTTMVLPTWRSADWRRRFKSAAAGHDTRSVRAEVFQNTLAIVRAGGYRTENGKDVRFAPARPEDGRLYDSELPPIPAHAARYETRVAVVSGDTLAFSRTLDRSAGDICALNMASGLNPGGGVFGGAGAQEEYLFRCTDYYRTLYSFKPEFCALPEYAAEGIHPSPDGKRYPLDRNFGGCFSRGVTVFRDTEEHGYRLLDAPWKLNFVAVPAISHPATTFERGEPRLTPELAEATKRKMRTIFHIAWHNGQCELVLGAFGCGAFRNPPGHIAELFCGVLAEQEFADAFRAVWFVIKEDHNSPGGGNFPPFRDVFGDGRKNFKEKGTNP